MCWLSVLFPGELFPGSLHTPTLAAQYIIKNVVLVAAGMVIASTWTGARIVPERRSMRSTLGTGIPGVYAVVQAQGSSNHGMLVMGDGSAQVRG